MNKKMFKILCPLLMVTVAVGSYLITKNNTLAKGNDMSITVDEMPIKNTIDIIKVKALEGIEGVTNLFYYDGESTMMFGMNPNKNEDFKSNSSDENSQEYYRKLSDNIYSSDINSVNPKMLRANNIPLNTLDTEFGVGFSPNGTLVDFSKDKGNYIFNLKNDTVKKYSDEYLDGNWSEDSRYIIKYGRSKTSKSQSNSNMFFIYDMNGTLVKKIPLHSNINWIDISHDFYSKDGSMVYFLGRSLENNILKTALFKLDIHNETVETVFDYLHEKREKIKNPGTDLKEHPGEFIEVVMQSQISSFEVLDNSSIIYTASVDSINGLYIYNPDSKTSSLLLNYEGTLNFSLAPNDEKIIFSISKPFKSNERINNIYVANIKESAIDDITLVKENCTITNIKWSNDSKELISFDPNQSNIISIKFK